MDYISYFKDNNLDTIDKFFIYMSREFKYGYMDNNGFFHKGVNTAIDYCLQSPMELINSKTGICWDITELCRCFFDNMTKLRFETYYMFYDDNRGCPSHSILVFYKGDKVFYFEPMSSYNGIHEYDNIDDLLRDAINHFAVYMVSEKFIPINYDKSKIYLYIYNKPNYHINGFQMRDHINKSVCCNVSL